MTRNTISGLTDEEQRAIDETILLWSLINEIPSLSADDRREAMDAIHCIQRIITHVAFASMYRAYWRYEE